MPLVRNEGRIDIGAAFWIRSSWVPAELVTGPDGRIEIGDGVWLNFGTVVNARHLVQIGDRSMIGQYSILADTEVPEADGELAQAASPIRIGADVWIAGRVTILPGTTIGDGSVITAGSVVSGEIPAGVVAGGIPARILRHVDAAATVAAPVPPAPTETAEPGPVVPVRAVAELTGLVVADFTAEPFEHALEHAVEEPLVDVATAPYGQVAQVLLGPSQADFAVVWTRPETMVESFRRVVDLEQVDEQEIVDEVGAFAGLIEKAATNYRFVFVPTWTVPAWRRGVGAFDAARGGVDFSLATMNRHLVDRLAPVANVHVLDAGRWLGAAGRGYSTRAWYLGKVPFHDEVFTLAASDVKAALRGLTGRARKLLVLDLDDTLWGGIVGDVGWEQLRLGGHDAEGEAYVDFQRAVKAVTNRGVVLGVVSKNEEATALDAIRRHPEMVLREDDFVGHRINWNDKARNIADLAADLNLGLQSVVFIDDNPVERARVREALPEVLVPEWPTDKLQYPEAFAQLDCFDLPAVTAEDLRRSAMYRSERQRDVARAEVGSLDDWLVSLGTVVRAEPLGRVDDRAGNAAAEQDQPDEPQHAADDGAGVAARGLMDHDHELWTIHVSDRFGDAGLTGIVSLAVRDERAEIVDLRPELSGHGPQGGGDDAARGVRRGRPPRRAAWWRRSSGQPRRTLRASTSCDARFSAPTATCSVGTLPNRSAFPRQ